MSRQPIDQLAKKRKPQGQEGVWEEIRRLKTFTKPDIHHNTDIPRKTITDYIKRMVAGGYVREIEREDEIKSYELIRDVGIHPPRVRPNGEPVVQGAGNANMWRTMRMMKLFTPKDIMAHSNTDTVTVSEATAKKYCSTLLAADYLRVMQKAKPGVRQATYKLIRNTGPLAPQIQRVKQVFDPNINEVTYSPGAVS